MGRISPCTALWPQIQGLLNQNLTRKQIAGKLGLSFPTVQAFLQRRNIPSSASLLRKTDEVQMRALLAEGATRAAIAEQLGVANSSIDRLMKRRALTSGARTGPRAGAEHPEWKGGRVLDKHGYVQVWMPLHPLANHLGRYWEHRAVWEVEHRRFLTAVEVVHHHDNVPYHNWPTNLGLYASNGDHLKAELGGQSSASSKGGARPSPRVLIPGAYHCSQKLAHCPTEDETLAQCPSETRDRLAWYIESFRPTREHRSLARRAIRGLGAHRDPFQPE